MCLSQRARFSRRRRHHLAERITTEIPTAAGHIQQFHIDLCDVPPERIYLGLYGSQEGCASYDIMATPYDGPC